MTESQLVSDVERPTEIDSRSPKIIPINLVFDYPVRWSRFKVLRDLFQNFYDAVGYRRWQADFSHDYTNGVLKLRTRDTGFSFEWLLHIGASTKRERNGEYAGYFGEGFKIAALCAVRDYKWGIAVRSRNWYLKVTTAEMCIEGRLIRSLAYQVWADLPTCEDTLLWVLGFCDGDRVILNAVLPSFYYSENLLFGECLWSTSEGAIWTRSSMPKPAEFPAAHSEHGAGIVFSSYQARGAVEFPLVFCSHTHRTDDRERDSFFRMDEGALEPK